MLTVINQRLLRRFIKGELIVRIIVYNHPSTFESSPRPRTIINWLKDLVVFIVRFGVVHGLSGLALLVNVAMT